MKSDVEAVQRASRSFDRLLVSLRSKGMIPEVGLSEHTVQEFIMHLASMDANNRFDRLMVGAGEREGRVISPLVRTLHLGLAHGIGRSGNLTERQPKAVGSSILVEITNKLALDAIRLVGITDAAAAMVVPMATGMALALCLGSWRHTKRTARYVIFLRIDQKSCFKSIIAAGYEPIVIDPVPDPSDDSLTTDLASLEEILTNRSDDILAVLSTTSCFAPRAPDDLEGVGRLCAKFCVKHLVNNAYGLQSSICCQRVNSAGRANQVDAFVQSTDKNFLVPVGGSIVATFSEKQLDTIANFYPGRASAVPSRDLLITLLQLGRVGLKELHSNRERNFITLQRNMQNYAKSIGQRLLDVRLNRISLAITLDGWTAEQQVSFGAQLFARGVTGARAILNGVCKTVDGYEFVNFGSHSSREHQGYLNVACAIGMSSDEIEHLMKRLLQSTPKLVSSTLQGSCVSTTNISLQSATQRDDEKEEGCQNQSVV